MMINKILRVIKVTYLILMLPATLIYGSGYALGLADDSERPGIIKAYAVVTLFIILPALGLWQSCTWNPIVQKKMALEALGYRADNESNRYINSTYEWLNSEGKFDTDELKKYKDL